jgi:hypothetical protein
MADIPLSPCLHYPLLTVTAHNHLTVVLWLTNQPTLHFHALHQLSQSRSESHVVTDGQSIIKSWCWAPKVFCICCWPSPTQSFSGPSPLGLVTISHCLRFETSLSVISYDSLGYGGGIRPRLHTGITKLGGGGMLRSRVGWQVCLGFKHPSWAYDQIFIIVRQLRVRWCGALSLTRGWVCRLQSLLGLASAVILGSESHIFLSELRDSPTWRARSCTYIPQGQGGPVINPGTWFPFRRLLQLAGLQLTVKVRLTLQPTVSQLIRCRGNLFVCDRYLVMGLHAK